MSADAVVAPCQACGKPATMKCPKCCELSLPDAPFCSQDCFKGVWATHKAVHSAPLPDTAPLAARVKAFRVPAGAYTGTLRPWYVTPRRSVEGALSLSQCPDYWRTGDPASEARNRRLGVGAEVRTAEQVDKLRTVCRMAREIMDIGARLIRPGVTAEEVDEAVHLAHLERGAYPSPLNYSGFPKSCCISVNEVICHGIPDCRPFEDGDIVKLDISTFYQGWHADLCETYPCGTVDEASLRLSQASHDSLWDAIAASKPGFAYRDIGEVITGSLKNTKFSVVRQYCGHGVGTDFHCNPNIPHYAKNKAAGTMKKGHTFTIEPMVNGSASWGAAHWDGFYDGWVAVTEDGARSAQFEHTMVVTDNGVEVLTARLPTSVPLGINEDKSTAYLALGHKF
jgi:methionyl aminopeptidase